jgi:hypothetical protein
MRLCDYGRARGWGSHRSFRSFITSVAGGEGAREGVPQQVSAGSPFSHIHFADIDFGPLVNQRRHGNLQHQGTGVLNCFPDIESGHLVNQQRQGNLL